MAIICLEFVITNWNSPDVSIVESNNRCSRGWLNVCATSKILGEIVERFGTNVHSFTKDNVRYNCPECANRGHTPDSGGHLWVKNSYPILFHCWRCEYSGKIDSHTYFDNKTNKRKHYIPEPYDSEILGLIEDVLFKPVDDTLINLLEIPKNKPLPGTREYNYLIERGLPDSVIKYYDMRLGLIGSRYSNRIIVPNVVVKGDGDYDYTDMFVARYIGNPPDGTSDFRKYLNPPGTNKRYAVYNIHRVKENSPIIITEGCFTAIAAGPQAVATYGKHVTDFQLNKILEKKPSKLYVNLDPDAYTESNELCERLQSMTSVPIYQVKFCKSDGEHADAADISAVKYKQYLNLARRFDSLEVMLQDSLGISSQYLD